MSRIVWERDVVEKRPRYRLRVSYPGWRILDYNSDHHFMWTARLRAWMYSTDGAHLEITDRHAPAGWHE